MPDAPLPFTPRALTAEHAALYCGMSRSAWDARVAAGKAPEPFYMDARPRWLREDLDAWLDAQAGRMPASAPNPWDAPPDAPRREPAPRP
jgi:predicted DNA-binding transcriptional regulator AlpA